MRAKKGGDGVQDILIVDDDPIIRDGLCHMLGGLAGDHALYTATNGDEALERICSGCIGLVFADVKMPVCDGIELLEKLNGMGYQGEVVIISGFDDYHFVRKAMKLGAADYILKPVVAEELHAVYQDCVRRLAGRRSRFREHRDTQQHMLQSLYAGQAQVVQLIQPASPGEREDFLRNNELPADTEAIAVVMDCTENGLMHDADKQTAFLSGAGIVDRGLGERTLALVQGEYRQLWTMLALIEPAHAQHARLIESLQQTLREEGVRFGISQRAWPVAQIPQALAEAQSSLEAYFFDLPAENAEASEPFPFAQLTERAIERIAACDAPAAYQAVTALCRHVCALRPSVEQSKQLFVSIMYTVMNRNKDFIAVIGKYKFTEKDIVHVVREAQTMSYLKKCFLSLVQVYIDALNERQLSRDEYAAQKARAYIESGYQNNLSLGEISEHLGLHPNYLSSLFRQKTGKTFSEYLRGVRIAKAVELMRETNLKVYEIASHVGYNDNAQFYRAFKQITGVSPGQYKGKRVES